MQKSYINKKGRKITKNRRKKEGNLYPTFVYKNVTTYQNEIEIIAYSPYLVSLEYIFSNLIVSYNCLNLFENKMDEIIINMTMNPNTYSIENLAFKFLRRSGYIKKLFDLKNKVLDLSLSLD